MCKDRTEIYKGTLEMMNLTKRKEKLTRMQRRGRTVGSLLTEVRDEIKKQEEIYAAHYSAE